MLFVGSIFNRRRLPDLVRAFGILARRRPLASLDLVGDNRTHPYQNLERAIATEGLKGRIRWHRYIHDDQLRDLYGRARAFAFLSEYEGLGMTPLEALRAATSDAARYLGLDGDLGTLEKGKLADLVVLDRNPLENIRNSESLSMVMLNGRLYDAKTLNEIGPTPRPRLPFWFESGASGAK